MLGTRAMAILHNNIRAMVPVPRSVTRHIVQSGGKFTSCHFPVIIHRLNGARDNRSPTTITNLRPKSDVISVGNVMAPSFCRMNRILTRGGSGSMLINFCHTNVPRALALRASATKGVNVCSISPFSVCRAIAHGCNFFRSFPTNIVLNIGALGKCIDSVGCIFAGRKTSDLKKFNAVNDLFPTR